MASQLMINARPGGTMEVSRPFVSILLFVAYFVFFGRYSIKKYFKGDVVINRNIEMTANISPPGAIHYSDLA